MLVFGEQDLVAGCRDKMRLPPCAVLKHYPVYHIHIGSAPRHGGRPVGYQLDDGFKGWPGAGGEVCYTCELVCVGGGSVLQCLNRWILPGDLKHIVVHSELFVSSPMASGGIATVSGPCQLGFLKKAVPMS